MLDIRTTNINTLIFQHAASNMHHGMLVTQVSNRNLCSTKKNVFICQHFRMPCLPTQYRRTRNRSQALRGEKSAMARSIVHTVSHRHLHPTHSPNCIAQSTPLKTAAKSCRPQPAPRLERPAAAAFSRKFGALRRLKASVLGPDLAD